MPPPLIRPKKFPPYQDGFIKCPDCGVFMSPDNFWKQSLGGLYVSCRYCSREYRKGFASKPVTKHRRFHTCVICKQHKSGPELWRYQPHRGDPLCRICADKYRLDNPHKSTIPKYFLLDGKKTCAKCKCKKNEAEFRESETGDHGLSFYCHECAIKMDEEYRLSNNLPTASAVVVPGKTKRCGRCGDVFDVDKFHTDVKRSDGLGNACKLCMKFWNNSRYKRGGKEYARQWLRVLRFKKSMSIEYWRLRAKSAFMPNSCADGLKALYVKDPHCSYCRIQLEAWDCQIDHKVSRYHGGSDTVDNAAICCEECNRAKASMNDDEFKCWLEGLRVRLNQNVAVKKVEFRRLIGEAKTYSLSEYASRCVV